MHTLLWEMEEGYFRPPAKNNPHTTPAIHVELKLGCLSSPSGRSRSEGDHRRNLAALVGVAYAD